MRLSTGAYWSVRTSRGAVPFWTRQVPQELIQPVLERDGTAADGRRRRGGRQGVRHPARRAGRGQRPRDGRGLGRRFQEGELVAHRVVDRLPVQRLVGGIQHVHLPLLQVEVLRRQQGDVLRRVRLLQGVERGLPQLAVADRVDHRQQVNPVRLEYPLDRLVVLLGQQVRRDGQVVDRVLDDQVVGARGGLLGDELPSI